MLIVGDWAPGGKKVVLTRAGGCVLANLEGPVLPAGHSLVAASKAGPALFSPELPATGSRGVFSLANNHLMDYGVSGLDATRTSLDRRGFKACGAGRNVEEARQPLVVDDNGVRVGIVACCEAQFGVATRRSAGVAEFGPWIYRAIRQLRDSVDGVIVSVHAAVEDSPWPSPYLRDLYRSCIDAGAGVVHGHHAHVPQGYEACGDGVIFYGMGNWAVDPDQWRDDPNALWSLAAEIDFGHGSVRWRPVTMEIREQAGTEAIVIEDSNDEERERHERYLEICNRPLGDPDLFEALWQEVAIRAFHHYGAAYMRWTAAPVKGRRSQAKAGVSLLKDALLDRAAPSPHPGRDEYLLWHHMVACESHRQMLATALGVLAGEIADVRTEESRRLADDMMPWSRGVVPA